MNSGLPNTSALVSRALLTAGGYSGVLAWILQRVLSYVFERASTQLLVMADGIHVAIIVKHESDGWSDATDHAYQIVDQGKVLTQEEKDAIDKPVMDAFVKLATFRVRKP